MHEGTCGLITIPVVREGQPAACFVVDTGASCNAVDPTVFTGLHSRTTVVMHTPGGPRQVTLCDPPNVSVGPFQLQRFGPVASLDCAAIRAATHAPIVGILGLTSLAGCVVTLDAEHGQVTFAAPDGLPHPERGPSWPMTPDEHSVGEVNVPVNGEVQALEVDTGGFSYVSLTPEAFDRLQRRAGAKVTTTEWITANGKASPRQMILPKVSVAGMDWEHMPIEDNGLDVSAELGLKFLEHHSATLDFPGNRLYLRNTSTPNRPTNVASAASSRP